MNLINKTYHPVRLTQSIDTCRERLQTLQAQNPSHTLDEISRQAYAGLPQEEFDRRVHDSVAITNTINRWAHKGRRIFDFSALMEELADATAIEFNSLPDGTYPACFYAHFGYGAGLYLKNEMDRYVSGVYVTSLEEDDEPSLSFIFSVNSLDPLPLQKMSMPDIMRERTCLARIAVSKKDISQLFTEVPIGDPELVVDPVYRAATLRALVALRHIVTPKLEEENDRYTAFGRMW
ncbi:hypothetical protein [Rhizobium lusitanum]|uniref:Uncharacterized protein n=1 Tax=Rhizobium lusitanum TaxID=293958 RepID=A0A7X0IXT4_9HYPH|nr:hypothetical protein [Rhizobium lusitanum]MBB6487922.1 hypothetical protein [Rhizobium lusitanum]